jgi:ADP-heptose:LPS heptosyltransferase
MELKLDCRHFRGDKPCRFTRGGALRCPTCGDYAPMGTRILIVKLDAIGDVARTTALLPALAKQYKLMHLTWLVAPEGAELLRDNPHIDVVLPYDAASLERLRVERFDLCLSLDKTARACAVGEGVKAREKRGFGLSEYGTVYPLDKNAEYAFELGLSDELKFRRNARTYQDVIFEVAGLKFKGEDYCITLNNTHKDFARQFARRVGIRRGETVIGLNLGGGGMFAHKMWDAGRSGEYLRLVRRTMRETWVLLFGADREREKMRQLMDLGLERVASTGTANSLKEFQALLGLCSAVVTGDSLGMHLALAEKKPVLVLFGPTCAQEIELYGRGEKIVSPADCGPCYRAQCDRKDNCMNAISAERVLAALKAILRQRPKAKSKRALSRR